METKSIGQKIRAIRELKNLSKESIAELSGLSLEQVSELEEKDNSPTVSAIIKIARALGVRIGTFLDDADYSSPLVTKGSGIVPEKVHRGTENSHLSYFSLAKGKPNRYMEPFIIEIEKGKESDLGNLSSHEGEEFLFCLEGVINLRYGDKEFELEKGDSIYYDSIVEHYVTSNTDKAKVLTVFYMPV